MRTGISREPRCPRFADRVHLVTERSVARQDAAGRQECGHDIDRHRDAQPVTAAERAKARRKSVDRLARHEPVRHPVQRPQHAVRRDERRKLQHGDHQPIQNAHDGAKRQACRDAERNRAARLHHRRGQTRRQADVRANGEIEASGENRQGESRRDQKRQARLPKDVEDVRQSEERLGRQREPGRNQRGLQEAIVDRSQARLPAGWPRAAIVESTTSAGITSTPMLAT